MGPKLDPNRYDPVDVVIATSNKRTDLLFERSLRSVYEQKDVNPMVIYIVDDNEKQNPNDEYSTEYYNIKFRVKKFRKEFFKDRFPDGEVPIWYFHTVVLPNKRTHGNSGTGAWNTAIYRLEKYGKEKYVAILDDDDEWKDDYLRRCLDMTKIDEENRNKKVVLAVVSGIRRMGDEEEPVMIANKNNFNIDSFFIGNPGFYGSNIFVRLREFLTVGAFDESLSSATDRDLAIRLLELNDMHNENFDYRKESYYNYRTPEIRFIEEPLVNHFTSGNDRVTSDPKKKKDGLDRFYRKYIHRMDEEIKDKSLERAKKLFNYDYGEGPHHPEETENSIDPNTKSLNLLIGVISNSSNNLRELFKSFLELPHKELLEDYRIVVLENTDEEYKIRPIINYFKDEKGLNIELIDINLQTKIIKDFPFKDLYENEDIKKKSISYSRSLLQYILHKKCDEFFPKNAVTWIIDDDSNFDNLIYKGNGDISTKYHDHFSMISHFKENEHMDAILGTVTDAPSLPFLSTLRTQMLDLYFNLKWFENQDPKQAFHNRTNLPFMVNNRDFYYDLSSEYYEHLESPFWWTPIGENVDTIYRAFSLFLDEIALFSKGVNIFRPLVLMNPWGVENGESIFRDGNTIVFDIEMLKVPNLVMEINNGGKKIVPRRSDFNWAIINKKVFEKKIVEVNLPLRHHRRLQGTNINYDYTKIQKDLYGMVFYRCLNQILDKGITNIDDKIYRDARISFEKQYKKYIINFKINLLRSEFLLEMATHVLSNEKNWWFSNKYRPNLNDKIEKAKASLNTLAYEISKRKLQNFIDKIEKDWNLIEEQDFKNFIDIINNRVIKEVEEKL